MNHFERDEKYNRVSSVLLCLIVLLSFFYHNIMYTFSASTYVILFALLIFLYIISKQVLIISTKLINWIWIPSLLVMLFSYYCVSTRNLSAQVDVFILCIGMIFCIFSSSKSREYLLSMKTLIFMGAYFSFGVVLQQIMPVVFRICLFVFPSKMANRILISNHNGFTTNPGFAAAYICVGIIALMSYWNNDRRFSIKRIIMLVCFIMALLFTGKRAHPVFLIIALLLCYLLPSRGMKRMKRYWNIFIATTVVIILFFALKDVLVTIPFVSSVITTIDGLFLGEDVTSSRTYLFAWAWKLFLQNPLFGIGWGDYSASVVGNVTYSTELDTHNIYLQLLCETGVIGFIVFLIPFIIFWLLTQKVYCKCVRSRNAFMKEWENLLFFSLAFQTFFLIYGFTGNPLYDVSWQILYMLSCGITLSYIKQENKNKKRCGDIIV